jgi:hypothetical protein
MPASAHAVIKPQARRASNDFVPGLAATPAFDQFRLA